MLPYPGAIIAGRYELVRTLAEGGMGSVWVARHAGLGTQVAVKFMSFAVAETPGGRMRFEREAKAAAALQSPHVVQVIDYGVDEGTPYLVMELLLGEDLAERLRRARRITLPEASRILTQAAKALRKAHEMGIVHRDLKPNNLFLARTDEGEIVKVLDFGIAKDASAAVGDSTRTGEFLGSPKYMSPEQVRCEKDIDGRSDIWSLAVILYRALTGRLPFTAEQPSAILAQIIADPIPPPSSFLSELPPGTDEFFARAFARDRNARFQTVQEMAAALAAVAGERGAFPTGTYTFDDASLLSSPPSSRHGGPLSTSRMARDEALPSSSLWPTPVGAPSTLTTGSGVMPGPRHREVSSPALLGVLATVGLAVIGFGAYSLTAPLRAAAPPVAAPEWTAATTAPSATVVAEAPVVPVVEPATPPTASAASGESVPPPTALIDEPSADDPIEPAKKPAKPASKTPGSGTKSAAAATAPPASTTAGGRPAWGF